MGTRRRFSLAPEWQEQDDRANERAFEGDRKAQLRSTELKEELRTAWSKREASA